MHFAEIIVEPQPTVFWRQLQQIGVNRAVIGLPRGYQDWRQLRGADLPWAYSPLAVYQDLLAEEGLEVSVIEDNPPLDNIRFGRAGREEELENVRTLIRAMGRLGIPTWCYSWVASIGWLRTRAATKGRGGALVSSYDHSLVDHDLPTLDGAIGAEALWDNLIWFLERILPVAEEAGVRLALHPDDPPVSSIRGVARVVNTVDSYVRLFDRLPSTANAMTLCQGNFTLMTDDLPRQIRDFGHEDRIAFVHFRDVRGTPEKFVETFHDEGQTDMLACMKAYQEVGYSGVMRSDHVPLLEGDRQVVPGYSDQGRLFAIGYMTGLREAAQAGGEPAVR